MRLSSDMATVSNNLKNRRLLLYGAYLLIFIAVFMNFNKGIDFTDTGYMLNKYENFTGGSTDFSMLLANAFGSIVVTIFRDHGYIAVKAINSLILFIGSVFSFNLIKKYYSSQIALIAVISGIAIMRYYPIASGYIFIGNSLAMIVASLLIKGIENDSKISLFMSGFFCALNVFIRVPNITYFAIYSIFLILFFQKKNFSKKDILFIIYGTAIFFLLTIVFLFLTDNMSETIDGILRIKEMASTSTSHSIVSLVQTYTRQLIYSIRDILWLPLLIVLYKFRSKIGSFPAIALFSFVLYLFFSTYFPALLSLNDNDSSYLIFTFIVSVSIILCLYNIIFNSTSKDFNFVFVSLVLFLLTPMGSEGTISYLRTNMIFMNAILLSTLWKWFSLKNSISKSGINSILVNYLNKTTIISFTLIFAYFSITSLNYVYRDSKVSTLTCYPIHKKLYGMMTTSEKCEIIDKSLTLLEDHVKENDLIIIYGSAPLINYLMGTRSPLSQVWVELGTYSISQFESELYQQLVPAPILITKSDMGFAEWNTNEARSKTLKNYESDEKYFTLMTYMSNKGYVEVLDTEMFVLYQIKE